MAFEAGIDLQEAAAGAIGDHHGFGRTAEGLGELFLADAQGVFGTFALGGVEEGADQVGLALQFDVLAGEHTVEDAAVAGAQPDFLGNRRVAGAGIAVQPLALAQVLPETQFQGGATDGFGGRPAQHSLEMLVGLDDQAVGQSDQ
ncbi:hypothetical protein D3C84_859960 [compost metagenome]